MEISSIGVAAPVQGLGALVQNQIEQAFLEEMLKYAGPSPLEGSFGGGHGEEQFFTFMNREYAAAMAAGLDLGFGEPT